MLSNKRYNRLSEFFNKFIIFLIKSLKSLNIALKIDANISAEQLTEPLPNFRYYLPTELPNFHLQSDISKVDIPFRELVARRNLPQVLIAQLPSISAQHPGLRSQHHTLVRIDVCF